MTLEYSRRVMNNFLNPKNMGKMKNPDGIGKIGNPQCGDIMQIYIKVKKENKKEIIKDIKFETFGCAAAIATSSMITQMSKGKPINYAEKITHAKIAKKLGGLPLIKMHCSTLAVNALKKAIQNYKTNSKIKNKK